MKDDKKILQITISSKKPPKSRIGLWRYWKVSGIWWPKMKSKFYGGVVKFMYWLAPKSVTEEWDKEFEEVEVHIINELDNNETN